MKRRGPNNPGKIDRVLPAPCARAARRVGGGEGRSGGPQSSPTSPPPTTTTRRAAPRFDFHAPLTCSQSARLTREKLHTHTLSGSYNTTGTNSTNLTKLCPPLPVDLAIPTYSHYSGLPLTLPSLSLDPTLHPNSSQLVSHSWPQAMSRKTESVRTKKGRSS